MVNSQVSTSSHRTTLQPAQPDCTSQELVALPPLPSTDANSTNGTNGLHRFLHRLRSRSQPVVGKALSLLVFVVSVVALWAATSSAVQAQKATSIAEWTSKKDFLEFCENHGWDGTCGSVRNVTLGAPPGFSLEKWRRWTAEMKSTRHQKVVLDTTKSDLQMTWLSIVLSSLVIALLLSHRRVQRKILYLARRYHAIIALRRFTKLLQVILNQCCQHQESILEDEEKCWGIDDLLDRSSLPRAHLDEQEAAEIGDDSKTVPTDEDLDLSAWAAEFEIPEEQGKLRRFRCGCLDAVDWWDIHAVETANTEQMPSLHVQSPYSMYEEMFAYSNVNEQRFILNLRKRAEHQRNSRRIDSLQDQEPLVDKYSMATTVEENYEQQHGWELEDGYMVKGIRQTKNVRKRVSGRTRYFPALDHTFESEDDREDDDDDCEDEEEDEYEDELECNDNDEDGYEDWPGDAYAHSDEYDSKDEYGDGCESNCEDAYEDDHGDDWEDGYEQS